MSLPSSPPAPHPVHNPPQESPDHDQGRQNQKTHRHIRNHLDQPGHPSESVEPVPMLPRRQAVGPATTRKVTVQRRETWLVGSEQCRGSRPGAGHKTSPFPPRAGSVNPFWRPHGNPPRASPAKCVPGSAGRPFTLYRWATATPETPASVRSGTTVCSSPRTMPSWLRNIHSPIALTIPTAPNNSHGACGIICALPKS